MTGVCNRCKRLLEKEINGEGGVGTRDRAAEEGFRVRVHRKNLTKGLLRESVILNG